jgi:hypothetical protein
MIVYYKFINYRKEIKTLQKKLFKLGYTWRDTSSIDLLNHYIIGINNIIYLGVFSDFVSFKTSLKTKIKRDFKEDTIFKKFFKSNLELG